MMCNFYAYMWWVLPKLEAFLLVGTLIFGVGWIILCTINSDETDVVLAERRKEFAKKFMITASVCAVLFIIIPDKALIKAFLVINDCRIK
ncbi:hypothetical protein [Synechococcus phage BUCT-ZZ01]|nr:hypothetical protein [Synechococcus phage BUCT-ZZ01]